MPKLKFLVIVTYKSGMQLKVHTEKGRLNIKPLLSSKIRILA